MLTEHTTAPNFSLPDQTGKIFTRKDFSGKWLVLYFYPKDDTLGCTKEACGIAEVYQDFVRLGVSVCGVSKDSISSHATFVEKYDLPFTLLSDESTKTIRQYGAWKEKSMYGRKYMGIDRITYIIDPQGKIARSYSKVSPAEHAGQLLTDLADLCCS